MNRINQQAISLKRFILIYCFIIPGIIGYSQAFNGTVIRVIDGDTYVFQTIEGSFIVRMQGIDAPERTQPFSKESAEFLSKYLNKDAITRVKGTDRYGRRLGTLFIGDQDINLLSIRGGYSWHYKQYLKDQEYAKAEEYARENKLGLWNSGNPVPPWKWR